MSSLIIEVCRVEQVDKHANADRLCVCTVKGWRVCAGRDPERDRNEFAPGDKCIYIPPDAVLPPALSGWPWHPAIVPNSFISSVKQFVL
jgi:hypothetical protein